MKKIDNTARLKVFGVEFENIDEAIRFGVRKEAKDGVYVGVDRKGYPCFDSEDYASENRSFWNVVFAKSMEELEEKMIKLRRISPRDNYNKFSEALVPMAYWGGDSCYKVEVTDDIE